MRTISSLALLLLSADAFAPNHPNSNAVASSTQRQALWRHWVPETDAWEMEDASSESEADAEASARVEMEHTEKEQGSMLRSVFASSLLATILAVAPNAQAVSGG